MKQVILILTISLIVLTVSSQNDYKRLMEDNTVNFYDVCREAEAYFETHDKDVKGSGWKGYQRWKNANEYKYFPSGDRSNIDPFFVQNAYKEFLNKTPLEQNKSSFNNGWNELGPFSIDSITGHYAAGLGRVEDHYVNPNNTNIIYVGSRSGGFWKTNNGGGNWQNTTDFLPASGVNTIAVSPTNSDSILINIQNAGNGNSHGIYRSIDGGNTWTESNFNPINIGFGGLGSDFKIYEIKYHPRVPNLIFIGTSKGIYRSDNNLVTWTRLINSGDIEEIQFHPTNDNLIYTYDSYYWGGHKNVVMRSTDQGLSYTESNIVLGNNDNRSVHLSVSNDCNDCLYWGSDNGVWKSIDNGVNFTFISNSTEGCGGFAVNDQDTSVMIYGYVDIDRSIDGGNTWVSATKWSLGNTNGAGNGHQNSFETSTNYVHADLHPVKCINGIFYVGTDGLFCKSIDNGETWINLSQGIAIRENYKIGVSQSNHYRSISGSQDNGSSIKLKDNWLEFYGADGMEGLIHPLNDDWIISSLQSGGRRRTKNGGQSQDGASPPGQSGSGIAAWEAPITYDPNNQMTIYNFSKYVFKSDDFGSSWDSVGAPVTFTSVISQSAIAENNSDIILISNGEKIEKSIDGGITFVDIRGTLPNSSIQDIAFDPNDDNTIIVVYGSYQNNGEKVYKTTDGGTSWTNITYNLGDMPIHSVVIDHTNSSNIYLGAEIGVYTMPINATNWALYNQSLPNTTIEELEIVNGSNTLKAATWGRGMWEYTLVGRNDFPSILKTSITNQPTDESPKENVDQFVTSIISYENTLSNVYVAWSIDNPTFNNFISMTNTLDSTWVSNTAIPNYPSGTKIYFKVFAVGANNDTTETYKFMFTVHPFIYCDAQPNGGQEHIRRVQIANINNGLTGQDGYTYYADSVVYLVRDSTYLLSINTYTGFPSNDLGAWIDYNYSSTFDSLENIGLNTGGNLGAFNFTVPATANITDTLRLRVRHSYWGDESQPCGDTHGEVEDYPVIIIKTPSLNYTFLDSSLCDVQPLAYSNDDLLDSISWTFTNIINNNTYTSSLQSGTLTTISLGNYKVQIEGYKNGYYFVQNYNNAFSVGESSNVTINETTCDINNVGTVIQTLVNKMGCDSIVSTITTLGTINATITINEFTLIANPAGLEYQWLNCNENNAPINGETNQSFITTLDGSFSVRVNDNACVDTATCEIIADVGMIENSFKTTIFVYPNPTNGTLKIDMGAKYENVTIDIINSLGQNVFTSSKVLEQNIEIEINIENESEGIYYVQIKDKNQKATFKIIKNN